MLMLVPGMPESNEKGSTQHVEHLQFLGVEAAGLRGGPDVARHLQVPSTRIKFYLCDNTVHTFFKII